jgi:hypothetical protein
MRSAKRCLAPFLERCQAPFRARRESADGTPGGGRTRRLLLIAEIATAVILVTAAHLLLDSLGRLRQSDVGFRTERPIG